LPDILIALATAMCSAPTPITTAITLSMN
jgi:hypothetical protein